MAKLSDELRERARRLEESGRFGYTEMGMFADFAANLEQSLADARGNNTDLCRLLDAEQEKRELAEARLALIKSLPMTVHDAPAATSADLLAYLDARGYQQERPAWERDGVEIMRFYQKPGSEAVVQVPMADGFDDFKSRVYDFFRAAASVEYGDERKQLLVWLELHDIHADALRKGGEQG